MHAPLAVAKFLFRPRSGRFLHVWLEYFASVRIATPRNGRPAS